MNRKLQYKPSNTLIQSIKQRLRLKATKFRLSLDKQRHQESAFVKLQKSEKLRLSRANKYHRLFLLGTHIFKRYDAEAVTGRQGSTTYILDQLQKFSNVHNTYSAQLFADLQAKFNNMNLRDWDHQYLKNVEDRHVIPTKPSYILYDLALLTPTKYKYYIEFYEYEKRKEENHNNYRRIGAEVYPHGFGKHTEFGEPAPSEWVYWLKIKHAFKARTPDLFNTMRNDLRNYLLNLNRPLTTHVEHQQFTRAVVNAFIPNVDDMYAHTVLSSKHVMSGIDQFNKLVSGSAVKFDLKTAPDKLKLQTTTL
jgi:hypothetical protein